MVSCLKSVNIALVNYRAINYDEKDPFLCHVCGFCKYAKFDYTLTAKQVCAIESIDSDDDCKKITSTINQLLEKADRTYKILVGTKPSLEVGHLLQLNCLFHQVAHCVLFSDGFLLFFRIY